MSLLPSCLDLLDRPVTCPGCRMHAPLWAWVRFDGLSVLTHDGDVICPSDRMFGVPTGSERMPSIEPLGVTA